MISKILSCSLNIISEIFLIVLTDSQLCPGLSEKHLCSGNFLTLKYLHLPALPLSNLGSIELPHWIPSPHFLSLPHHLEFSLCSLTQLLWQSFLQADFNCCEIHLTYVHLKLQSHIDNSFENFRFPLAGLISNDLISFSHLEALKEIIARWLL